MSWSVTKERGAGYRKNCENLVGKSQKRPEKRRPNRLRLGRRGEENGEVRLPSCCLSMPPPHLRDIGWEKKKERRER